MTHYLIGEFSQMSGVSKDTLRYYDKAGVLSPSLVAENGYRYYTEYDLMELIQIRTLRGTYITLDKCQEIRDLRTMSCQLALRDEELQREIEKLTNLQKRIAMLHDEIENCLREYGQCQEVLTVPTYSMALGDMTKQKGQLLATWMQHVPYVHVLLLLDDEKQLPELQIGILKSHADTYKLPVDQAETHPAQQAVRTVLKFLDPLHPTQAELVPVSDYLRAHRLHPTGPWRYRIRFIGQDEKQPNQKTYYAGICIAVAQD